MPALRPTRVAAVLSRARHGPLLDRLAALPELELKVLRRGRRTRRVPGRGLASTLGVRRSLASLSPDIVLTEGWSSLASQTAIAWSRVARVPYVLLVEERKGRAGRLGAFADAAVSPIVQSAAGLLVESAQARRDVLERGAAPERVRVLPLGVGVAGLAARVERLRPRRAELRAALGAGAGDIVILTAGTVPEDLVHAVAETRDERLLLVPAGDVPERERLIELARVRGVRLAPAGDNAGVELYAAADVFALLSAREPWAVVAEAAACGLPLVLAGGVAETHDLLEDGRNGVLVEPRRVEQASAALRWLASDEELRRAFGARSKELARDWGYGPSVDGVLAAVREAVAG